MINPDEDAYKISECLSGDNYLATFGEDVITGQVFSTIKTPGASVTYSNLVCYTIGDKFTIPETEIDFNNLPILALPVTNYETCEECEKCTIANLSKAGSP